MQASFARCSRLCDWSSSRRDALDADASTHIVRPFEFVVRRKVFARSAAPPPLVSRRGARAAACFASPPSRPSRAVAHPSLLSPSLPLISPPRYTGRGDELGGESAHNTVGCLPHFDKWGVDLLVRIVGDATNAATVDATVGDKVHKRHFELAELASLALYEAVTGELWRSGNADLYTDPPSVDSESGSSLPLPGEITSGHVLDALVRALVELHRLGKRTGSVDLADLSLVRSIPDFRYILCESYSRLTRFP